MKLDPQEVRLQLRVPLLYRPKTPRDRRKFIYYRDGVAVLGQIDRLNVVAAGVASLDSDVVELVCRVNDKLFDVFFSTGRTQHALKVPFVRTKTANERTLSSITLLPQDASLRLPSTKRTNRKQVVGRPLLHAIGEICRRRL